MIDGIKLKQAEILLNYLNAIQTQDTSNLDKLAGLILCFTYTSLQQIVEDLKKSDGVQASPVKSSRLGRENRRFKSCHSDQYLNQEIYAIKTRK